MEGDRCLRRGAGRGWVAVGARVRGCGAVEGLAFLAEPDFWGTTARAARTGGWAGLVGWEEVGLGR